MNKKIDFHPHLKTLVPYQAEGGKLACQGPVTRLCFNEGAFGPNPKALAAAAEAGKGAHVYPDIGYTRLRKTLADKYGLDISRIVIGAGSDDILNLLLRAFVGAGDEVLVYAYGYSMYALDAKAVGATPIKVGGDKNLRADLNALLAAVTDKTRMVCLANPNNPTGSWIAKNEIEDFISRLPPHILFVYDAAYAEFMVNEKNYSDGLEWVKPDNNICVTRTFSKIHGLGGMRVGWAYAPYVVVEALHRIRNPFNISSMSEAAAVASLMDDAFTNSVREHTQAWAQKLPSELARFGIQAFPSPCNFILARFASAQEATDIFNYMKERKILLRPMDGYGLADCLRITIGRDTEMQAMLDALKDYKGSEK